ncbi:MAG: CofH family radical SAM protein, partial [Candidatus Syntropharchaeia archaeon]
MIPDDVIERAEKGEITEEDALYLMGVDPFELFILADRLRKEKKGDFVTYVINRNINFTNLCVGDCSFCAFRSGDGYVLSLDQIIKKVEDALLLGATEVCIQGGLMKGMKVSDYCEILENIKSNYPEIHIHAFSPAEVMHAARNSEMEIRETLKEFKRAGLDSMPGTAAEILVDEVRRKICPNKITSDEWIGVIKTAHRLGIPTTATMMYGHVESIRDRIEHLFKIREIQKETKGFTEFVPLSF